MRPNDTITIEGWMLSELALEGNTLILYAALYQYSRTSPVVWPTADLARWLNLSERSCQRFLKKLEQMGLLMVDRSNNHPKFRALRQLSLPLNDKTDAPDNLADKIDATARQILKEERSKEENIHSNGINKNNNNNFFLEEMVAYASSLGQPREMAEAFFHYNASRGWMIGNQQVINWKPMLERWCKISQPTPSPTPNTGSSPAKRFAAAARTTNPATDAANRDYLERKHQREREEALADEARRRELAAERAKPECQAAMQAFFARFNR